MVQIHKAERPKLDSEYYYRIEPIWKGETVVVMASGPSLSKEDIDLVYESEFPVITVNTSYQAAPWADICYACDMRWWKWHKDIRSQFNGVLLGNDNDIKIFKEFPEVEVLHGEHKPGLSYEPDTIHYGKNSGYQALNIAVLTGASRVLLLGYDHKPSKDGRTHWFGDHPHPVVSPYKGWIKEAWSTIFVSSQGVLPGGCQVINCCVDSALPTFPRRRLIDVL